jgi:tRNA-uridine 2-sulfurtransferase
VNKGAKIFVGISGGVDSSVSAYLLKKEGYDVHGIFVKTWAPEWLPCTWVDEKRDAMRICAALDIPFHFLDAEEAYKNGVAEYMIHEYKVGRTPNPDVLCNRVVKFGVMWEYAKSHGAEALATGHYAQTDGVHLIKGIDSEKDQAYFLWMLKKEELAHIIFPIGHMKKSEVRDIATKANLFTSTKKDSQGICFLGDVDMKEFLSHYITETPGEVRNEEGKIVGHHDGVFFHTVGERHGFTITEQNTNRKAYYVVGKDIENNVLVVSHNKQGTSVLAPQKVQLREINWLSEREERKEYHAQIRYHGSLIPVIINSENEITIDTTEPLPLGQSIVIYDGDTIVGGGVIDLVLSSS